MPTQRRDHSCIGFDRVHGYSALEKLAGELASAGSKFNDGMSVDQHPFNSLGWIDGTPPGIGLRDLSER